MQDNRSRLIALLQLAYSGEKAAAYAYRGHWKSVSEAEVREKIQAIEEEEWRHRQLVGEFLDSMGSGPNPYREIKAAVIGHTLGFLCRLSGWLLPMYGAGKLESRNIREYEAAARYARGCGRMEFVECLLRMAEVEWEHEQFFRLQVQRHSLSRLLPLWPEPPPRESIRTSFDKESGDLPREVPSSCKEIVMKVRVFLPALLVVLLASAQHTTSTGAQQPAREISSATEGLGLLLFWDPVLSGNRDIACATCHHPDFAYADGRELSLGTGSVGLGPQRKDMTKGAVPVVKRNSPTILNVAFNGLGGRGGRRRISTPNLTAVNQANAPMLWDNRVRSLELQALEPLKAFEEMRGTAYDEDAALDTVVSRLRAIPEYVSLFETAFGPGTEITALRIGEAIAAFERTLLAVNSPFDRFRAGETSAMTAQQQRGFQAFQNAGCDQCHGGAMFSDFRLHAEGVAEHSLVSTPDNGGGQFRFRTPTLRNIALTAPYMHNGTLATLEDVLKFYDEGRSQNPNVVDRGRRGRNTTGVATLDRDFQGVRDMSSQQMQDIVAFLEALSDPNFDRSVPARVPSGLPPGGAIGAQEIRSIH